MAAFVRVLLATDFTPAATAAEVIVQDLCRATGASCVLFHAIEPVVDLDDAEGESFYESLEQKATESLRGIAARFDRAGVRCEARVVIGERWRAILETAETERCDLITMGSHVTDRKNLRIGTTSHKVFYSSPIPILMVRTTAPKA